MCLQIFVIVAIVVIMLLAHQSILVVDLIKRTSSVLKPLRWLRLLMIRFPMRIVEVALRLESRLVSILIMLYVASGVKVRGLKDITILLNLLLVIRG
jgi:hypothetical protein